ncbi:MAG: transposase [Dehalococcoidia bacterium]|jgi:REP element-mobilizing transposase RayT
MMDKQDNRRRSVRLKEYDYSRPGAYFVTICTKNRECLMGRIVSGEMKLSEIGLIAVDAWEWLAVQYPYVELDISILMPNHLHGIIMITNVGAIHELPLPPNNPMRRRIMLIPKIIGYAKMNTAKFINQSRNTPGTRVWQRNYYEHVIRNEADLAEVREYILNNPARWDEDDYNPDLQPGRTD